MALKIFIFKLHFSEFESSCNHLQLKSILSIVERKSSYEVIEVWKDYADIEATTVHVYEEIKHKQ